MPMLSVLPFLLVLRSARVGVAALVHLVVVAVAVVVVVVVVFVVGHGCPLCGAHCFRVVSSVAVVVVVVAAVRLVDAHGAVGVHAFSRPALHLDIPFVVVSVIVRIGVSVLSAAIGIAIAC
eukprot:10834483-Alexandrium_andersonii.AAC.1